jgi:hypothetical protein
MKKQAHTIKSVEMALHSLAVTGRAYASAVDRLCEGLEFCAEKLKVHDKERSVNRRGR